MYGRFTKYLSTIYLYFFIVCVDMDNSSNSPNRDIKHFLTPVEVKLGGDAHLITGTHPFL